MINTMKKIYLAITMIIIDDDKYDVNAYIVEMITALMTIYSKGDH